MSGLGLALRPWPRMPGRALSLALVSGLGLDIAGLVKITLVTHKSNPTIDESLYTMHMAGSVNRHSVLMILLYYNCSVSLIQNNAKKFKYAYNFSADWPAISPNC